MIDGKVYTFCQARINFKNGKNMKSSVALLNLLRIALSSSAEWKGEGRVDWTEVIGLARKQGVLGYHTMMSIILSSFLGSVPWRIMFQFLTSRHIR